MHEVLVIACSSFVRWTDRPDMTVAADWDAKQQIIKLFVGYNTPLISYLCLMKCPKLDQSTSTVGRYQIVIEHYV